MTARSAPCADAGAPLRWCVLRMSGPRTLSVLNWLIEAGIDAWTPTEVIKRRRPRSTSTQEITVPIASTFVFAPANDADELQRLLTDPVVARPAFTLLRYDGRVVKVADRELAGLRDAEEDARPGTRRKVRPDAREVGSEVKLSEGAFAGMTGIVESSDGRRTYLDFGGLLGRVEIDTDRLPMAA